MGLETQQPHPSSLSGGMVGQGGDVATGVVLGVIEAADGGRRGSLFVNL
jgi:hypothetical protein